MGNRAPRDPLYPCAHTGERPRSKEKLLFLWGANRNLHAPCNCFLYCFLFLLVCGSCFAEATGLCYGQIERKWSFFIYIKKQLLKRTLCPRISMVESVWDFLGLLFSIQTLWEPQPGSWYITSMKYEFRFIAQKQWRWKQEIHAGLVKAAHRGSDLNL